MTAPPSEGRLPLGRRQFLAFVVAAPTLAVAVDALGARPAAALPGTPEPADFADLGDYLILAQRPTEGGLILLVANEDGTVTCDLPREEVGQGITTSVAMLVADELSLPLERVRVTLADARPELVFGQITGGSNTIRSVVEPIAATSAAFRGQMAASGARLLGVPVEQVRIKDGAVLAADGRSLGFGELAGPAGADARAGRPAPADAPVVVTSPVVGTERKRTDARAMVTGAFQYTNDLEPVEGLLRSMVRRAPTIRGRVVSIDNLDVVQGMEGVVDVFEVELSRILLDNEEVVETGVAVVAETFGQALDAKEALEVTWDLGPLADYDDERIRTELKAVNPAPATPVLPGGKAVDGEFDWAFVSHAPLESNTAIADVRKDGSCEVWAGLKIPIIAQQTIAEELGLDPEKVTVHVVQGGGSFGRRLFFDSALEAARISAAVGRPVKHMWTRIDDMRHGRARAASNNRLRITHVGKEVVSFEQRVASVETDWRHGLGEALTSVGTQMNPPSIVPISSGGNATFSQSVFASTVFSPYDFGTTSQSLNEINLPFNTGAWRAVYSPNARGAEEVMVDELAASMGEDPAALRMRLLEDQRYKDVLAKALELGEWGRALPPHTAQGLGFHAEYKSATACLVEVERLPGERPRVTRAAIAADYGKPVNPLGLKAQLIGGLTDAICTVLTGGLHLEEGLFLEGSYSQFHFPRLRDTPPVVKTFIFPETTGEPGGAGELGVPAAVGAIINAYSRVTGEKPRRFPIFFDVDFEPFTKVTGSTRRDTPPPK